MLKLITQPQVEPVTLDEVKIYLRYYNDDLDNYISSLIKSSRILAESYLNKQCIEATYEYTTVPTAEIEMPNAPFIELVSVKEYDTDENETTLSNSNFIVKYDGNFAKIKAKNGYSAVKVKITYKCGYGEPHQVPQTIKTAICEAVNCLFNNEPINKSFYILLNGERVVPI